MSWNFYNFTYFNIWRPNSLISILWISKQLIRMQCAVEQVTNRSSNSTKYQLIDNLQIVYSLTFCLPIALLQADYILPIKTSYAHYIKLAFAAIHWGTIKDTCARFWCRLRCVTAEFCLSAVSLNLCNLYVTCIAPNFYASCTIIF